MSKKVATPALAAKDRIVIFQEQAIRCAWYENEWWFSVIDVVGILSETAIPKRYWSDLKRKLAQEAGSGQPYEKIVRLKLSAPDGKQRETDCASTGRQRTGEKEVTVHHFITKPIESLLEVPPQNGYSPNCPDIPTGKWVLGLSVLNGYGLSLAEAKPAPLNGPGWLSESVERHRMTGFQLNKKYPSPMKKQKFALEQQKCGLIQKLLTSQRRINTTYRGNHEQVT